jgi:hypothetical protein
MKFELPMVLLAMWLFVFVGAHPMGEDFQGVCHAHRGGRLQKSTPLHAAQDFKGPDQSETGLHGSIPSHGAQTMARQTPATAYDSGQDDATPSWTRWIKTLPETH